MVKINLLLFLFLSVSTFASQVAIVKSRRARVYSDMAQKSSIGYISQGKRIRVGNMAKFGDSVLPIVVQKRICYIKKSDVYLVNEIKTGKKVVKSSGRLKKYFRQQRLSTRKNFHVTAGFFPVGSEWEGLATAVNKKKTDTYGQFYFLRYEHHPFLGQMLSFSLGGGITRVSDSNLELFAPTYSAEMLINLFSFSNYFFDLNLSGQYSNMAKLEIGARSADVNLSGMQIALQLTKIYDFDFGIRGGMGYQQITVSSFKIDATTVVYDYGDLNITGMNFYLAFLYRF